jgi:thioredoxin reductase (NADPH)
VRPDIENRIRAGQVRALFETSVTKFEAGCIYVQTNNGEQILPARKVFALTGYHPDFDFLRRVGVDLDPQSNKPRINAQSLESNIPGLYLAGVVIGGNATSEIFIENGRFHGKLIVAAITGKPIAAK